MLRLRDGAPPIPSADETLHSDAVAVECKDLFLSKPLRDEAINTLRCVAKERAVLTKVRLEKEEAERVSKMCPISAEEGGEPGGWKE